MPSSQFSGTSSSVLAAASVVAVADVVAAGFGSAFPFAISLSFVNPVFFPFGANAMAQPGQRRTHASSPFLPQFPQDQDCEPRKGGQSTAVGASSTGAGPGSPCASGSRGMSSSTSVGAGLAAALRPSKKSCAAVMTLSCTNGVL